MDCSPLRRANNLESVRTYEGTDEAHTLILGKKLTRVSASGGASAAGCSTGTGSRAEGHEYSVSLLPGRCLRPAS